MARWKTPEWMHDFHVPGSTCPHCGAYADGALATTGIEGPRAGDAMLCIACGGWCVYTELMTRRAPTADEAEAIAADPGAQHVREVWAATYRRPR